MLSEVEKEVATTLMKIKGMGGSKAKMSQLQANEHLRHSWRRWQVHGTIQAFQLTGVQVRTSIKKFLGHVVEDGE